MSFINEWDQFVKKSIRKSKHLVELLHIEMNKNTFVDSFFFHFDLFLPLCFCLLSAFSFSKLFWNNEVHCEIIDLYFNIFFIEIQLKKEDLKHVFGGSRVWMPKLVYQSPKQLEYANVYLPIIWSRNWSPVYPIIQPHAQSKFYKTKIYSPIIISGLCLLPEQQKK